MDITAERAKQCYIKHYGTEPEQAGFYHYQEWDTGIFVYAHNKNVAEAYIKEQRIIRSVIWSFGPIAFSVLVFILLAVFELLHFMLVLAAIAIYVLAILICSYQCKKCRNIYDKKLSIIYYR